MKTAAESQAMGRHNTPWTDAELDILRNRYPYIGAKRCARELPGRTPDAIRHKASCLGSLRCVAGPRALPDELDADTATGESTGTKEKRAWQSTDN